VGKFQRKTNRDAEEQKLQEIASKGVSVLRDVDRESFKKVMSPIYDQFSGQFSKADLDVIMNAK
jgi:TRAP-type C4-dicarboxylate transport system substrate-binding protein